MLEENGHMGKNRHIVQFRLVSCPGNKFQNLSTTVVPVQSHLALSVSSQKALDMSQLWKVFLGHDTLIPKSWAGGKAPAGTVG